MPLHDHDRGGGDVRGFYAALGIDLSRWAKTEASVRCFTNPNAHNHQDRRPSCSVNLTSGAFNCHGCQASGGAYDAAVTLGHSPAQAIGLMVAHGLTEYRAHRRTANQRPTRPLRTRPATPTSQTIRPALAVSEDDLTVWQGNLAANHNLIARLERDRGWTYHAIRALGLGLDRGQITIPTRDEHGHLNGLLRYRPWPRPGEPKMLAAHGTRRTLFPHPATEPANPLLLVEGEPDAIAARSHGWAAIAIPGIDTWRPEWANYFNGRDVTIITDADRQGRQLAQQVAHDLRRVADATVLELTPERDDGHDLTDWLIDRCRTSAGSVAQLHAYTISRTN